MTTYRIHANAPPLISTFVAPFGQFGSNGFTDVERQVLLLSNAVANRCAWAAAFHSTVALAQGEAESAVEAIRGRLPGDPRLAALSATTRALIDKRGRLDEAAVSIRHLCFIETGRARPSRTMVLRLAEVLDAPLRERNTLLLAAGFAPEYQESALDAPALAAVQNAIEAILAQQEPYPAVVMDRDGDIRHTNNRVLLPGRRTNPVLSRVGPEHNHRGLGKGRGTCEPRLLNTPSGR